MPEIDQESIDSVLKDLAKIEALKSQYYRQYLDAIGKLQEVTMERDQWKQRFLSLNPQG